MHLIIIITVTLVGVSFIWFIAAYKRDLRKNKEIFGEYLENQKTPKYRKSGLKRVTDRSKY